MVGLGPVRNEPFKQPTPPHAIVQLPELSGTSSTSMTRTWPVLSDEAYAKRHSCNWHFTAL